jgi:hypothetical protein
MENEIKRTIKFYDKKCVMKPMEGESGLTELWNMSPGESNPRKTLFKHEGKTYYLVASSSE